MRTPCTRFLRVRVFPASNNAANKPKAAVRTSVMAVTRVYSECGGRLGWFLPRLCLLQRAAAE